METKEIFQKLHQFVNEVSLGYKGTIDLILLREAADRLDAMDAQIYQHREEIADLEKQLAENQPEWISVEDRLPKEHNKHCLVSREGGSIALAVHYGSSDRHYWSYGDVTHWLPLPEPPKPKEPTFKDVFLKAFPKAVYTDVDCCTIFPKQFNPNACNFVCEVCWNHPYFEEEEGGEE